MDLQSRYCRSRDRLLSDLSVCPANRAIIAEFLTFEEYKLRRQNGLPSLDDGCCKTLLSYLHRLRNVNLWFENKPWTDLTREDLSRVYDGLEDGLIRTKKGERFEDRRGYYNKIFRGKPFRLAGKDRLAREVIEFSTSSRKPVRFIDEASFRRLCSGAARPTHRLLLWLAWDIGENIGTLLKLTTGDLIAQTSRCTREREYLVHLPQAKLKRTRQTRSELTVYPETVRAIDLVLTQHRPDDRLFRFGYQRAATILSRAATRSGARTMPGCHPVRWKDLRSGMACHLLRCGWTRDEVNARLGHTPRSEALDAYINFLALDRDRPKQRLREMRAMAPREHPQRAEWNSGVLQGELQRARSDVDELRQVVTTLMASLRPAGA